MDNLNLYWRNPNQLEGLLHQSNMRFVPFSNDIEMKFGLDKYAIVHFVNSKISGHAQFYGNSRDQYSTMRERLRRLRESAYNVDGSPDGVVGPE
jgi:hypothetical protein